MNPFSMRERFEARNGEYVMLLDNYFGEMAKRDRRLSSRVAEALRLLHAHERLIAMCVGFEAGLKEGGR